MKKNIVFTLIITIGLLASNLSVVFADDGITPEIPDTKITIAEDTSTSELPKTIQAAVEESSKETEEVFQENDNTETFDFSSNELPENWEIGGDTELTGNDQIDPEGDGWLRLTGIDGYELGYAVYDQALSTENGLAFNFDYSSWGGSGADGIAFFLMDGETSMEDYNSGGVGGSLGYAPRYQINEGLSNAVVGIGLDEFGNFSDAGEGRKDGPGRAKDSVTVRGAGNGFEGYEFIDSTGQLKESIDISKSKERPDQTGDDYRYASVLFLPVEQQFSLTLNIQFGADNEPEELFSNLLLPGNVPATVKFGFTATSGGSTNYHEIRNLIIDKAVLNDIEEEIKEEEDQQNVITKPKKSVSVPVSALITGNTLTIIPVTGSEMYPLSCSSTSILEIKDQAFALIPALCDYHASLVMEEIQMLPFTLPEEYTYINAAYLTILDSNNMTVANVDGEQIKVGFYIGEDLEYHSLTILTMQSGQWIELEVEISDGIISTVVPGSNLFILAHK